MALLKEWNPSPHSLAAIWKIEESEGFFAESTGITSLPIKHEKRRLEHLAGRHLLKKLKEDFPLHHIAPDLHDKPRIPEDRYRFSISHSYPYVAAEVSDKHECGIDIQTWHRHMLTLQDKFLSGEEQDIFAQNTSLLTLAWCAKEAAYKWHGRRGIDFIQQMHITNLSIREEDYQMTLHFHSDVITSALSIRGYLFPDFAFAHVEQA